MPWLARQLQLRRATRRRLPRTPQWRRRRQRVRRESERRLTPRRRQWRPRGVGVRVFCGRDGGRG